MNSIAQDQNIHNGHTIFAILRYFYPELITTILLYGLIYIDNYFISQLAISAGYTTLGYTNMLFQFITKIAEGFSVGMVILCGYYNSKDEYKNVGSAVSDAFWATSFIGTVIALALFFGASIIYNFFQIPQEMVSLGVPFLRLRAIGVLFNFIYFALLGFFRGIKNTKIPMYLFMTGSTLFVFFDYVLIFGKLGFPKMGFMGSATASVIQYSIMLIGAFIFILQKQKKYDIKFFRLIKFENIIKLISLSWPVMLDKASLALCNIWLGRMMGIITAGTINPVMILGAYTALKDIERIALVPGLAFAQVLTLLTSNDSSSGNWSGIMATLKRVFLLSYTMVSIILLIFFLGLKSYLNIFDVNNVFTSFVIKAFPIVAILIFLDLSQLILSALLRGAGKVQLVMKVRWMITILYFLPVTYIITFLPIESMLVKFMLIYGTFHISGILMSIVYLQKLQNPNLSLKTLNQKA